MKKLFRYHRGSLTDSLATTIEVNSLEDIRKTVLSNTNYSNFCVDVYINTRPSHNLRLSTDWGVDEYTVMGKFADGTQGVIGMCNFYAK